MGDIMENIGQLAATIFGFGFAFFAIWFHYDGKKIKQVIKSSKKYSNCHFLEVKQF